jgi:hypothetical protein
VLGALGAGFFLIPRIGTKETLILAILINFALGVVLFGVNPQITPTRKGELLIGVLILLGASSFLFSYDITFKEVALASYPEDKIIYHQEDAQVLVEVYQNQKTGTKELFLNRQHLEGDTTPLCRVSRGHYCPPLP